MIRALRLYNFKCFEDQLVDLGALTLLSGVNSTGKSTVLQALLLLRQSLQQGRLPDVGLSLNGDLARIGTASDALFIDAKEDYIGFDLALWQRLRPPWVHSCSSRTRKRTCILKGRGA